MVAMMEIEVPCRMHYYIPTRVTCRIHYIAVGVTCRIYYIPVRVTCRIHYISVRVTYKIHYIPVRVTRPALSSLLWKKKRVQLLKKADTKLPDGARVLCDAAAGAAVALGDAV
jgi:hypothetical protein